MDLEEKIILFLNGELSDEENKSFLKELRSNRNLAEKVELERLVSNMEERVDDKVIKDKMARIQLQDDRIGRDSKNGTYRGPSCDI